MNVINGIIFLYWLIDFSLRFILFCNLSLNRDRQKKCMTKRVFIIYIFVLYYYYYIFNRKFQEFLLSSFEHVLWKPFFSIEFDSNDISVILLWIFFQNFSSIALFSNHQHYYIVYDDSVYIYNCPLQEQLELYSVDFSMLPMDWLIVSSEKKRMKWTILAISLNG